MTTTDETRFQHQARVRWGVVCGDGEVVWARDEAAARRLLASLVGAIRIVCEEALAQPVDGERISGVPAAAPVRSSARSIRPLPR